MTRRPARSRLYRSLLRLFPPDFRAEFGADMELLFHDRQRDVRERGNGMRRLWAAAVADVVWQAMREWGERGRRCAPALIVEGTRMDGWTQDIGFGVRTLLRRPAFTLVAVGTLALGIGANISIFSVVNGVLLRPLPYPESGELVVVWTVNTERGTRGRSVSNLDLRDWQADVPALASVAGYGGTRPTLTGHGDPMVVYGARVSDGLLETFGLAPELGRDIAREEDVPGGPRSIVLSHAFWSGTLGRDPEVLGRTVVLNGEGWEVVGVAPVGFDYPNRAQFWIPRHHDPEGCGRGCRIQSAVGRLADGVALGTAQEQMDLVSVGLEERFPESHTNLRFELERLTDSVIAEIRTGLWVLMGAVGMVLLIACANVANLLLVRAADREDEVALRATLGAGRLRLARQLFTESLLLASAGGAAGVAIAVWGTSAVVRFAPEGAIPRLDEVGVDLTSLAFALLAVCVVTVLFGLVPVLRLSAQPLARALGSGRRAEGRRGSSWSRSLLLAGEVALSLSLLLGAGLLTRTMSEIARVEPGFTIDGIDRFRLSAPESRYDTPEKVVAFFDRLESEIQATAGVRRAGMSFGAPFTSGNLFSSVELLDREEIPTEDRISPSVRPSTPGYLEASGIQLLRGRWISTADRRGAEGVVVINARVADELYPGQDPIGRQMKYGISWGYDDDPVRTIVGVVGSVRSTSLTERPARAVYFPNAQFAANAQTVTMALEPGIETVMPAIRVVLGSIDPELAITNVESMADVIEREHGTTQFYLTLLGGFSALALILAGVGLYGVVAYAVSRRTREIGIRIALGAVSSEVVGMVVRQGIRPAFAGIATGLLVSWFGARVLQGLLYGVTPHDPMTLVGATLLLGAVTTAATLLPARRASKIPPATALRAD